MMPALRSGAGDVGLGRVQRHGEDLAEPLALAVAMPWLLVEGGLLPAVVWCVAALTDYVEARKFYDYNDHSRVGAAHGEFVTDEICDRFCALGTVEQVKAKMRELEAVGVDQFNVYLMTHGQEETLAAYGEHIIPQFKGVTA